MGELIHSLGGVAAVGAFRADSLNRAVKYVEHLGGTEVPDHLDPVVVHFRDGEVLHGYRGAWEEPRDGRLTLFLARPGSGSPRRATVNLGAVEALVVAGARRERISLPPAV